MGSTSTLLVAPSIYKNAGYHAGSFAPVARVADSTEVLAVHPSVPAKSVAELIGVAKSRPGALNFASAGIGTLPHLEGELLKARAQIDMNHVPYRGGGQALTGLLAGEIQVLFSTLTQMLPYIRDGQLRGLAGPAPPALHWRAQSPADRALSWSRLSSSSGKRSPDCAGSYYCATAGAAVHSIR
jgi:tripartite-type tricarboxylate transporter receptor subunit TctC